MPLELKLGFSSKKNPFQLTDCNGNAADMKLLTTGTLKTFSTYFVGTFLTATIWNDFSGLSILMPIVKLKISRYRISMRKLFT